MKYTVCFSIVDHYSIEVEANSQEEASKQVIDRWNACEEILDIADCFEEDFGEVTGVYKKED